MTGAVASVIVRTILVVGIRGGLVWLRLRRRPRPDNLGKGEPSNHTGSIGTRAHASARPVGLGSCQVGSRQCGSHDTPPAAVSSEHRRPHKVNMNADMGTSGRDRTRWGLTDTAPSGSYVGGSDNDWQRQAQLPPLQQHQSYDLYASRGPPDHPPPSSHTGSAIFVGGLPLFYDDERLAEQFRRFGVVVRAAVQRDTQGTPRGFGIVEFLDSASAARTLTTDVCVFVRALHARASGLRISCACVAHRTSTCSRAVVAADFGTISRPVTRPA